MQIAAPLFSLDQIIRVVCLGLLGLGLAVAIERRRAARKQRRQASVVQIATAS